MKKQLISCAAIVFAISINLATMAKERNKIAQLAFKYGPSSISEAQYETVANWTATDFTPCPGAQSITCKVSVDDTQIAPFAGATQREKFVNFLIAQPSAATYVNGHTFSRKPAPFPLK